MGSLNRRLGPGRSAGAGTSSPLPRPHLYVGRGGPEVQAQSPRGWLQQPVQAVVLPQALRLAEHLHLELSGGLPGGACVPCATLATYVRTLEQLNCWPDPPPVSRLKVELEWKLSCLGGASLLELTGLPTTSSRRRSSI